jgi:hypothetical protein
MAGHFRQRLYARRAGLALKLRYPGAPVINIVGVLRSGTNLLKATMETHFKTKALFSEWHWKHGVPPTLPAKGFCKSPPVPIVVISKDPVSLNASLHWFWEKTRPELGTGRTLSEFVRSDFILYDNSFKPIGPKYCYPTPTDYWNAFHYAYLNWPALTSQIHFVQYDQLIRDTDAVLGQFGVRPWAGAADER